MNLDGLECIWMDLNGFIDAIAMYCVLMHLFVDFDGLKCI